MILPKKREKNLSSFPLLKLAALLAIETAREKEFYLSDPTTSFKTVETWRVYYAYLFQESSPLL